MTKLFGLLALIAISQPAHSSSVPPLPCEVSLIPQVIVTDRVTFKKTTLEDLEIIYEILQTPEMVATQGLTSRESFFEHRMNPFATGRAEFTVFLNGKIIGAAHITAIAGSALGPPAQEGETWASFGFLLWPEQWGHGLGTEIAQITFDLAKRLLHPAGFIVWTHQNNRASQKIFTKLGFAPVRETREYRYYMN